MGFLPFFLNLIAFIPKIVAQVQKEHAEKDVDTKTQIASQWLELAGQVAGVVVPASDAPLASEAATAAQKILAATVQAVHAAATPATVQPSTADPTAVQGA